MCVPNDYARLFSIMNVINLYSGHLSVTGCLLNQARAGRRAPGFLKSFS